MTSQFKYPSIRNKKLTLIFVNFLKIALKSIIIINIVLIADNNNFKFYIVQINKSANNCIKMQF